jgi:hypothetical protein
MSHLKLDLTLVNEARTLARHIADSVIDYIGQPTFASLNLLADSWL